MLFNLIVLRKFFSSILFVFIIILINNNNVQAQNLPAITYPTPNVYTVGSVITPLSPTNTGGAVFPANYSNPVLFASYPTPFSIAIDGLNNVYTTNNTTGDLTKFSPGGTVIFTVNTGDPQASGVAIDGLGNIYVSQFTDNNVLKYSSTGALLATITGFSDPYEIAFDASNNAYVANYLSGEIIQINAVTGTAIPYLTGFTKPYGVAIDATGNIFVGEQGPGDIIKVAAGTLTRTTFATGFNGPRHLNKDSFGNIYVADFGNNAIKRINPSGVVTTILSAGLSSPRQAAFNSSGNLFVVDFGSNTLLKSIPTTYSISAPLPAGLNFDTSSGQITGTPTVPVAITTYTVTAYNTGGINNTPLTITVGTPNQATAQVPSDSTLAASLITATTASLNSVASPNGATTLVSFTYGTDPVLANATTILATTNDSLSIGSNNSISILTLSGLTPSTKYYYRVTATNSLGTVQANILSFTTLPSQAQPVSSNAALSNLTVGGINLNPSFTTGTTNYTINVSNAVASVSLTPVASDPTATITVNGVALPSGAASGNIPLNVGINTVATLVTAQDGITTNTYTVTITRAASSGASLANLVISAGALNVPFTAGTNNYTASVGNSISSITVTPTNAGGPAFITINGVGVISGSTSPALPLSVGINTITTVITSRNGTTSSYTITITRAPSSSATLANLTLSTGILNPSFLSATTTYATTVSGATSSITITPTTSDSTSIVTVNGLTVLSGSASPALPLNVGNNIITTTITAQDGTTNAIYTVNVTRLSNDASLRLLLVSTRTLLQQVPGTSDINFATSVSNGTSSLSVIPATTNANATVTVNGFKVLSGTASRPIALNQLGPTVINLLVTAQDGITTKSYSVTVNQTGSSDAILNLLSVSTHTGLKLVPGSSNVNYTTTVGSSTTALSVMPTADDVNATVTINGSLVTSGTNSGMIALNPTGPTIINLMVKAQDGITTKTYSITVNPTGSSDARLKLLSLGTGTLLTQVGQTNANFAATVASNVTSLTVTPTADDANATITVNGVPVATGTASGAITLNALTPTTINLLVTAQDGVTTRPYSITVTKLPSNDATLKLMTLSTDTTIAPVAGLTNANLAVSVNNNIQALALTPIQNNAGATITVNGIPVISGGVSTPIALNLGRTIITTTVTAQDGTTVNTYKLVVTRRAPSSNATLANLALGAGAIAPGFNPATFTYNTSVDSTVSSISIMPITADANATTTVNGVALTTGTSSATINLTAAIDTITTVVTAQDGSTTNTYTVIINKQMPVLSSNANLAGFTPSAADTTVTTTGSAVTVDAATLPSNGIVPASGAGAIVLSPNFNPGIYSYSASVGNTVSALTNILLTSDSKATLTVNGKSLISGVPSAPIALGVGETAVTVVVTAQDGITKKTYTLNLTKKESADADSTRSITFNNPGTKTYGDADFNAGAFASTAEPIIYSKFDPKVISINNGTIHIIAAGTTTITATVGANARYLNLPVQTQTLIINKAKQTISFSPVPTQQRGTSYTLTEATSSAGLPITYKSSDSTVMSVKGTIINPAQIGSVFLTATQTGNANYAAASGVNQLITIHNENGDKILVHQAVSPNGDGVNDVLFIEGIENYPINTVAIINLNGETIYQVKGYDNSTKVFDGHSNINGRVQQPGTYFYMVEYTADGQTRRKTGYFVLKIN